MKAIPHGIYSLGESIKRIKRKFSNPEGSNTLLP
jgi:hypothetical protein